jgi:hypothetical protein
MNKLLVIPTLGLAGLIFAGVGVNAVKAGDETTYPPIVQKLIDRFNLNEDEVKDVFDEAREERRQIWEQNREQRLDQAVEDGVITAEQKQALLEKYAEMQTEKQQHKEEMHEWFEEQGIDHEALMQYGGFGGKGFKHGGMGRL